MTHKIRTKLLAILVVTAMALVSAFALIESGNSSGVGARDIYVNDFEQFKNAMNEAKVAPRILSTSFSRHPSSPPRASRYRTT